MSSAGEWADMQDNLKSKDLIGRCVLRIQGQSTRSKIRASDTSVATLDDTWPRYARWALLWPRSLANLLHKTVETHPRKSSELGEHTVSRLRRHLGRGNGTSDPQSPGATHCNL